MKLGEPIISGGGWTRRQYMGKPKARRFTFLSVAWLIVALAALVPFWQGGAQSLSGRDWLYGALLIIPEPIFIGLALVFWLTEERRLITEWHKSINESSLGHFMPW